MPTARVKLKINPINSIMLVYAAFMIAPVQAFWRHLCFGELGTGRVDPIMAPGVPSIHAHVLFGASNLGLDPTIDDLLDSNCTSCSILQDKSVYWTPRMYFQHQNGSFESVATVGGMTVYYFTEGSGDGNPTVAFPQNFRMIAGDALKRSFYGPNPDPPMSEWKASDKTQQALTEKAIGFNCLHYSAGTNEGSIEHHGLRNKTFIDSTCTDGIRAELMFPSCWNGQDLDSNNHTTHVAYPDQIKYGNCPEGYPVRLPTLFYETIYNTPAFEDLDGQFVFANGDPTGYGYHGDFICGWEDGVLQSAIDNPYCTGTPSEPGSGLQESCPIFELQSSYLATQCKMEIPEVLQNDSVKFAPILPGHVKIQAGPERAVIAGHAAASSSQSLQPTPAPGSSSLACHTSALTAPMTSTSSGQGHVQVTDTPISPNSNQVISTTTIYMSDGVEVDMVLVEEIVTVTAVESVPADEARKRHLHRHRSNG
ncbi:uncharacterized protein A1O9_08996 [Exophiala aquamarina CBS 119918]|uniref:DUF1996 domain-containing protein n=1 Tax=Exophiala aquamarina CBS 119918 TaxID=1182545 RepID=A0A072P357_9EURO|nr:uncharacterized protein A1O9_08996 [Exophiala aquamarina CBS 119918]KEF54554.1 hypothetical protein A1O9_08996 [Exophiala aquamarina CBS 119918]